MSGFQFTQFGKTTNNAYSDAIQGTTLRFQLDMLGLVFASLGIAPFGFKHLTQQTYFLIPPRFTSPSPFGAFCRVVL